MNVVLSPCEAEDLKNAIDAAAFLVVVLTRQDTVQILENKELANGAAQVADYVDCWLRDKASALVQSEVVGKQLRAKTKSN